MLIVEGPDGAGKTTLIERLAEDLDLPVAPRVVSKDTEFMVDMVDWVELNLADGPQRMIFDRHRLISEPIYGPVLRGTMDPGFDNLTWLYAKQQEFRQTNPFVIFCLPPVESVLRNVYSDVDNKVVRDHIDTIYWLYLNAASLWTNRSSVWDYTKDPPGHTVHYDILTSEIQGWIWDLERERRTSGR